MREPGLHVILSDFMLPSFDALSALRLARRLQPRVPFIVVTGSIDEETAAECIKAGAADYVLKDRIQRLWPAVRGALDKRRVQEERERALEALEESEQRYALAVHGANDGIWDWDLLQRRAYFSAALEVAAWARRRTRCATTRASGWSASIPRTSPRSATRSSATCPASVAHFECEHRVRQPDGSYLWVLGRGSALRDADRRGVPHRRLADRHHPAQGGGGAAHPRRAARRAHRARQPRALPRPPAHGDGARGASRRARLRGLLRGPRPVQGGERQPGPRRGRRAAGRCSRTGCRRACGRATRVARLGGDEFAVLVEDVASPADAIGVARRALEAFGPSFHPQGHELFSTASIGIVLGARSLHAARGVPARRRHRDVPGEGARPRRSSRSSTPSMHALASSRLALETDIRRALDRGEFRVFYQPLVDLANGRGVGFEALVRWEHPQRGWLAPQTFIGVAEEMGAIVPHRRVRAARGLPARSATWRRQYHAAARPQHERQPLGAAVHAGRHDRDRRRRAARRPTSRPANLRLEITESALMDDPRDATARLAAPARPGRAPRHRRLRHRLLLAQPALPLPDRRAQDRPLVRQRHGRRTRKRSRSCARS